MKNFSLCSFQTAENVLILAITLYLKLKFFECLDQGSANLAHGPNLIHHLFLYSLQAKNAFPPSILMSERQKRKK